MGVRAIISFAQSGLGIDGLARLAASLTKCCLSEERANPVGQCGYNRLALDRTYRFYRREEFLSEFPSWSFRSSFSLVSF